MRALLWIAVAGTACGRFDFDASPRDARDGRLVDDAGVAIVPVLHLALDEPLGAMVVHDSSPSGYDGNVPWPADVVMQPSGGKVGGAAHFDGVPYQSVVAVPSVSSNFCTAIPMLTGSLTVSAWVQFESFHDWQLSSLGDTAVMQGASGGLGVGWGLGATDGCGPEVAGFVVGFDAGVYAVRCGATVLGTGAWYFLTGVYDAAARTMSVYVDGVADDGAMTSLSAPIGGSIQTPVFCPYLGTGANEMTQLFGLLDEVTIFDRAFTAAQVGDLFHASGG